MAIPSPDMLLHHIQITALQFLDKPCNADASQAFVVGNWKFAAISLSCLLGESV